MFRDIFKIKKPIMGMIHLAGDSYTEKLDRALEELAIYEQEGLDGAIIEDYHGSRKDVERALEQSAKGFNIIRGVNLLNSPHRTTFTLASKFGAKFIQVDSVQKNDLYLYEWNQLRKEYPDMLVLGGVRFKYTMPTGDYLEDDIADGISKCDAVVTTGDGTGIETPLEKLEDFKRYLNDFPLIVGAGVNSRNVYDQLSIADGAIMGSGFKPNKDTQAKVDRELVKRFMGYVRKIRQAS